MQLEGYSNLAKLSKGGMATVYQAKQNSLDRTVAIKFLSAEFLWDEQAKNFFDQESMVIARLNHPNIIKVIDRGLTSRKRPYFVMEYVQGRDLEDIRVNMKLSFNVKLQLLMQICRGMAFAHKNGVVHRDIKPANILIDNHGHVYILDFGIAWLEASGKPESEAIVGTPDYMSPEQFSDPAAVSHLSDIYALGALMYQFFSGALPSAHFDNLPAGLARLPAPLVELIMQCLQTKPELRPPSADQVSFRLLKLLKGAHIRQSDREEAQATIGNAVDKFELLDVISRNKYGAVYLFEDKIRHIQMVVKKRVKTHAGFKQATQLKSIVHDNIIRVLGTSRKDQTFIVVMQYLSAGNLQDRLSRPFGLKRFLQVATEISNAMQQAHMEKILHGNLRPSNILFDAKGHIKVTDFGFSKHYSDNSKRDWYQPQSRRNPSVKRDIYSAGAIFYHMLTGSAADVRYGQLKPGKNFTALPRSVQELLRNMIEMQSLNRLKSFSEVLAALTSIQQDELVPTRNTLSGRFKLRYLVGFFLLANLGGLILLYLLYPGFNRTVSHWLQLIAG